MPQIHTFVKHEAAFSLAADLLPALPLDGSFSSLCWGLQPGFVLFPGKLCHCAHSSADERTLGHTFWNPEQSWFPSDWFGCRALALLRDPCQCHTICWALVKAPEPRAVASLGTGDTISAPGRAGAGIGISAGTKQP